jgi:hypothetical protein
MQRYSLNLLPQEDQKRIGYERLARFFTVVYSIVALMIVTGTILLSPTYFFLSFQNNGLAEQIAAAEQIIQSKQAIDTEMFIRATNTRLRQLSNKHFLSPSALTRYFDDVTRNMPPTLSLHSFAYKKETNTITLRGTAGQRANLLVFVDFLRNHPSFTDIEYPVTNILKEENIAFTISLIIIEDKPAES